MGTRMSGNACSPAAVSAGMSCSSADGSSYTGGGAASLGWGHGQGSTSQQVNNGGWGALLGRELHEGGRGGVSAF